MWYLLVNEVQHGPMGEAELLAMLQVGEASPDDLVWTAGMADWLPLSDSQLQHLIQVNENIAEPANDRTLIVNEDDGALQAELSALLGEVEKQSELIDRPTEADLSAEGHEPETIAMPSFVPGPELLKDIAVDAAMRDVSATTGGEDAVDEAPLGPVHSVSKAGEMASVVGSTVDSVGINLNDDLAPQDSPPAEISPSEIHVDSRDNAAAAELVKPEPVQPGNNMPRPTVRDTAAEMPNPPKRQTIEGIDNPMRVASGVPVGGHGDVAGMPIEHPDKASRASDDLLDNDDPEHQPKAAQLTASPTQTDGNDGHVRLQVPSELAKPIQAGEIADARQIGQLDRKKPILMGIASGLAICLLLGAAALILLDDPPPAEQNEARQVSNTPAIQLGVSRTQVKDEQAKEQAPVETPGTEAMPAKVNQTPQTPDQESKPDRAGVESDSRKATAVSGRPPVEEQAQPPRSPVERKQETAKPALDVTPPQPAKSDRPDKTKANRTKKRTSATKKKTSPVMSKKAKREERLTRRTRSKKTKAKTDNLFGAGKTQNQGLPFSLTHQQIVRVLGKKGAALKRCTAKDKTLTGAKVMVSITILRTGKPTKIRAVSSSVRGTDVGRCIERTLGTLRFPKFRGDNMRMTVPVRI